MYCLINKMTVSEMGGKKTFPKEAGSPRYLQIWNKYIFGDVDLFKTSMIFVLFF